jgi:hypothetical protein
MIYLILENENKSKKFDKKIELTNEEIKEQVFTFCKI